MCPKLVCHASCCCTGLPPGSLRLLSALYFCGFSHTRQNLHCSTMAWQSGRQKGIENFFSFPSKRYFIEFPFFCSLPQNVVATRRSFPFHFPFLSICQLQFCTLLFSIPLAHAPAPAAHLLCCWQVFKNFLLVFCVGFA